VIVRLVPVVSVPETDRKLMLAIDTGVGVEVRVAVGLLVTVAVGIGVLLAVAVGVSVLVGTNVGVPVGSGVSVGVAVAVGSGVGVSVGNGVLVAVAVAVGVSVGTGVLVGVAVGVSVGMLVGLAVAVSVGVAVGASVGVAAGVSVGDGVGVTVAVGLGVDVGVALGVGVTVATFRTAANIVKWFDVPLAVLSAVSTVVGNALHVAPSQYASTLGATPAYVSVIVTGCPKVVMGAPPVSVAVNTYALLARSCGDKGAMPCSIRTVAFTANAPAGNTTCALPSASATDPPLAPTGP
jgi:hypothetical protein